MASAAITGDDLGLGVATLLFGLAYAPNFRDLYSIWDADPNYSHGNLVIPIALFILWRRLSDTAAKPSPAAVPALWWGWVFLIAILVVRAIAYEYDFRWVETATLVPAIACLTWTFGSWPLLRRVWPAIVFLVFLLPLPSAVNDLSHYRCSGLRQRVVAFCFNFLGFGRFKKETLFSSRRPMVRCRSTWPSPAMA